MNLSRRTYLAVIFVLIGLKLWLTLGLPVFAIGAAKPDDQLFVRLAASIIRGDWLGPYDELTLAKGPGYSLWMAAIFYLGLPLTVAQQLAYAAACWLAVQALRPLIKADWLALALFAALLWNPMSYEMAVLGRILRQGIYTPLSLTLFAAAIALFLRARRPDARLLPWAVLGGLSYGGFWLTREEGLWIAPALALFALAALWQAVRVALWKRFVGAALVAVLCAAAPIAAISALNLRHYGWFGTVEFRAPDFLHAYGALTRVRPAQTVNLVPVTHETRLRLYALSPAFRELQPFLEGDIGRMAAEVSSGFTGRPVEEMEIAGGWFMWALREAVVKAGHGDNARTALQFYRQLAREIDAACDQGLIAALPRRATMAPVWRPGYAKRLREQFINFSDYAASFANFTTGPVKSYGAEDQILLFRDVTRARLAPWAEGPDPVLPLQAKLDETKRLALQHTGKVLRRVFFGLALLGLAGWLALGVQTLRRKTLPDGWVVGTATLAAFSATVLIVALVDISSFPTQNPGYFAHVYPLVILFGFVSCHAAWTELRGTTGTAAG